MDNVVSLPKLARRRAIKCVSMWTLVLAAISAALFAIVRSEPALGTVFDWPILLKLNHYASQGAFLNHSIDVIIDQHILTGVLLVGLWWYLWFQSNSEAAKAELLLGLGAAVGAVIFSRSLQVLLPTHLRPLHAPAPGFNVPPGIDIATLNGWDSFPSDHACLYFGLATVIWRRSPMLGLFALLPALLGSLPRIYLGYHYPSDVIFGALLGMTIVLLVSNYGPETAARRAIVFEQRRPGVFYAFGFLLTYEIGTLFEDIRTIGFGLANVYRHAGG
jgi:undecaprenyl-diphosphatase